MQYNTIRKFSLLASATACAAMLSGCIAPILMGGAVMTTATVATDRRTAGSIVSDEVVEKRLSYEIEQALKDQKQHITVTAYDGRVLLSGEAGSADLRARAEQIARNSTDVREVIDEIAVMEPVSVSQRLSDSLLATRVRTAIIGEKDATLNQMKVVVERGVVYLMGFVTDSEARAAAAKAAAVSGVKQVVMCFSIATAEEIEQRMRTDKPANAGAQSGD